MRRILSLTVFVLLLLSNAIAVMAAEKAASESIITFGIVPQQSATKLARLWAPILGYISRETGLTVVFRTAKDIPTFEQRLSNGEYDLAYMNPYHYTVFHETPGYLAFARARDKKIKGILVSRRGGDIHNINQLQGSTLAFPAPASFAASILTRAYLKKQGISFTPKYVSSHDSVYRTVAAGLYPAGGGVIRTLRNMDPAIADKLDILWESPGYTPHAFAALPGFDAHKLAAIQKVMQEMELSEVGQKLLQSIQLKGIESAIDTDWDDVRELDIRQLFKM